MSCEDCKCDGELHGVIRAEGCLKGVITAPENAEDLTSEFATSDELVTIVNEVMEGMENG